MQMVFLSILSSLKRSGCLASYVLKESCVSLNPLWLVALSGKYIFPNFQTEKRNKSSLKEKNRKR